MSAAVSQPSGWTPLGATVNTQYFVGAAPDVLIVVPEAGAVDDEASARANLAFQVAFARKLGRPAATVVLLSRLAGQDAGARRVYAAGMDPGIFFGTALIVSNGLSRAIGSFFLGLARPPIPTRLHDSYERALTWLDSIRTASVRP